MNWPSEGLTLETSGFESLYDGQFTLSMGTGEFNAGGNRAMD